MTSLIVRQLRREAVGISEEILDQIIADSRDQHYESTQWLELILAELRQRPDLDEQNRLATAREAMEVIEKRRAPKKHGVQASLFDGDALIILGDTHRCLMGAMTLNDALQRSALITKSHEDHSTAFFAEIGYLNERLQAWQNRPLAALREIESEFFAPAGN